MMKKIYSRIGNIKDVQAKGDDKNGMGPGIRLYGLALNERISKISQL